MRLEFTLANWKLKIHLSIIHEYMFDVNLFRTFVRIIVSGVCRACLRKLLSDTKYEKKKNFCQCIRQQKFFFFHLLMN